MSTEICSVCGHECADASRIPISYTYNTEQIQLGSYSWCGACKAKQDTAGGFELQTSCEHARVFDRKFPACYNCGFGLLRVDELYPRELVQRLQSHLSGKCPSCGVIHTATLLCVGPEETADAAVRETTVALLRRIADTGTCVAASAAIARLRVLGDSYRPASVWTVEKLLAVLSSESSSTTSMEHAVHVLKWGAPEDGDPAFFIEIERLKPTSEERLAVVLAVTDNCIGRGHMVVVPLLEVLNGVPVDRVERGGRTREALKAARKLCKASGGFGSDSEWMEELRTAQRAQKKWWQVF